MAAYRKERVADLLLGFLGEELRKMSDPRLELVTVTGIEVTRDLKVAKVYWSIPGTPPSSSEGGAVVPTETEQEEIAKALKGASGFLKRRIGEELELRSVPNLVFVFDKSVITGSRIDALLGSLK